MDARRNGSWRCSARLSLERPERDKHRVEATVHVGQADEVIEQPLHERRATEPLQPLLRLQVVEEQLGQRHQDPPQRQSTPSLIDRVDGLTWICKLAGATVQSW